MKRSVQEIVELLVFGLIALLIGTALLWLVGWVFDLVGVLFKFFAGLIWSLLRFIVPVAIVAAIVYALVRLFQQQRERSTEQRQDAAATAAATTPPDETTDRSPAEADESGKAHVSEVWVPPQPSPPAGPPPAEKPPVEEPPAGQQSTETPFAKTPLAKTPTTEEPPEDEPLTGERFGDEPFSERPFGESSPEDPTQNGPTLNRPPLDEWTVDSESPAESTAADYEPLGPETPPQSEEEKPIADEDTGAEAEEEDTDGDRRS